MFCFLFFFTGLQEENRGGQERVPESLGRVPSQSGFQGNAYDTQALAETDDGLDGKSQLMGWVGLPMDEVLVERVGAATRARICGTIPDFHCVQTLVGGLGIVDVW